MSDPQASGCISFVRVFCPIEFHPERLKFYMAALMSVCAFSLGVYLLVIDSSSPFGASLAMASLAAWVRMPSLPATVPGTVANDGDDAV